ncbi:MAG: hypothetical protein CO108_20380 [Deltaproteobacteria bacterium CG_4_9_14_3_um_filter_63_12]|nr:MAG: hypothetical protein CO108_20380 [Deltaproteobacteria bacterium CG_4_9_14_3_um_filter_63_12]
MAIPGHTVIEVLAICRLGEILVAFQAGQAVEVLDSRQLGRVPGLKIDLLKWMGFELQAPLRRALRFGDDEDSLTLLLGQDVWFEFFDPKLLRALPAFLHGLADVNGAVALLEREEGFALVLDILRVRKLHE